MKGKGMGEDFHMRVDKEFLATLDGLRADEFHRTQAMPTRADVIRSLVEREAEKRARRS
jgi:hypothetical protein